MILPKVGHLVHIAGLCWYYIIFFFFNYLQILNFLQLRTPSILPSLQEMYINQLRTSPTSVKPDIVDGVDCSFYKNTQKLASFGKANLETTGGIIF